jgi:hypothetical protein
MRAAYVLDPRIPLRAVGALALWFLGYPDQALTMSPETLAIVREESDRLGLAAALCYAANIHQLRREVQATRRVAEALAVIGAGRSHRARPLELGM